MNPSFDYVLWLIKVLCIIYIKSSSVIDYPTNLAIYFNWLNPITSFSSLSYNFQILFSPSFVLYYPIWLHTTSTNSSKVKILFFYLKAQTILTTYWFLLSRPSSSKTLTISCGSIVPVPSSSNIKKQSLNPS